jgi:hypothetical protein
MFSLSQAKIERKTGGENRNNTSLLSNTKPTTSAELPRPITRYIVIKKKVHEFPNTQEQH